MIRTERPLDLLEAAYRLDGEDDDWMLGLVQTTAQVFAPAGYGALGFTVDGRVDEAGTTVIASESSLRIALHGDARADEVATAIASYPSLPADLQEKLFFSGTMAGTSSAVTGLGASMPQSPLWNSSGLAATLAQDAFGLTCHQGPLRSVVLSAPIGEITVMAAGQQRFWGRMAMHIGAAARLRRVEVRDADGAEAVLSPAGQIRHLKDPSHREAIGEGFARRRRARTGDTPPDQALEIWQGLHDGRWSLVDFVDSDGKAFVLAVRNEPARDVPARLTDRQRSAVALAALGYGNKQIAYALGLTAAAVAMLLARSRAMMGVRTRAELVRAFKRSLATVG